MLELLLNFYDRSFAVTLVVIAVLFTYFFFLNVFFFYHYFSIKNWISQESIATESMFIGSVNLPKHAYLSKFLSTTSKISKSLLELALTSATKDATKGLTFMSLTASTSPFIGLFGTVVSILQTFSLLSKKGEIGALNVIAAGVSDALVATAVGIFVAIFAYSYHQILKRSSFELISLLKMQGDALIVKSTEK